MPAALLLTTHHLYFINSAYLVLPRREGAEAHDQGHMAVGAA